MNREIIFRGFHECENGNTEITMGIKKKKGEWVEGDLCHNSRGQRFITVDMLDVGHYVIPSTVRQFTGLTDKNGKKIFEHDIIKKGFQILEVLWNENQSKFDLYDSEGNAVAGFNKETSTFFEVLGNTFGNSNLIRGGKSNV